MSPPRPPLHTTLELGVLGTRLSGRGFADDIIVLAVRWYVRYRLSCVEVSEWLAERGILVDQSTIYRWVQRFLALIGEVARKCRDPVGSDWRLDETYARIRGRWHYMYRAIDGCGQIVDGQVSPRRDLIAARRFFERAIAPSGNDAAADHHWQGWRVSAGISHGGTGRAASYWPLGIEPDHGFLKERLMPMRGLKSTHSTAVFVVGHALVRNTWRGVPRIAQASKRLVHAWSWTRLAEVV
jgi:IS6 family transposase